MTADVPLPTSFRVHIRCFNCKKDVRRTLTPEACDDSPTTVDELVESGLLDRQRFICRECDSPVGTIVAVKVLGAIAA